MKTAARLPRSTYLFVLGDNHWQALPHDLPSGQTASSYLRIWRNDATGERIYTARREQN